LRYIRHCQGFVTLFSVGIHDISCYFLDIERSMPVTIGSAPRLAEGIGRSVPASLPAPKRVNAKRPTFAGVGRFFMC